ncbi:hypothetical protein Tco_0517805 [Tanacetum coccineum]
MEFESAHSNTTMKQGNYEDTSSKAMLAIDGVGFDWIDMAEEQVQTNMALMAFLDSEVYTDKTCSNTYDTSITKMSVPVTAEEKTNKKNDVKARSLLLMALPNEHQLTFSQCTDAKIMFAAIETRFRGNETTKKTQKTLLKQQYENFSASSTESLDSIFNRLQKIVSRLAILGVVITQEDLNSKILTSLPPEWNTHVVVWMNKAEIETMSIDDLYNNFKIVEQSVKKSVGASSGSQNLAFMTTPSTSSTNDVNTAKPAYEVSTVSLNVNTASPQQDLEQIHEDDLEAMDLKWMLSLLSMRATRYYQRTGKKIFINANDTAGYDKSKQGNNKDTSSKAMLAIDGVGFDRSDMAEEQVQTNMALMAFQTLSSCIIQWVPIACKDNEKNPSWHGSTSSRQETQRLLQLWKCFGRLYFVVIVLDRNICIKAQSLLTLSSTGQKDWLCRLAILGVVIAQEELNSNFLNSLPPEWNTQLVLLALMLMLASPSVSTARFSDNVVYAFMVKNPNSSNLLQQDLEQIHEDDLEVMDLKWQLSLLSMRAKRECRAPRNKEGQFRNQDNTRKQGNNEDTSSKAMLAIDGVGFDWSDMAEEQVQTNMALMAFSDSKVYTDKTCLKNYETLKKQCDDLIVKLNPTEFTAATYKRGLATVEEQLITYRKNEVLFSEEVTVLKREVAWKDYEINMLKSEFEKVKQEKEGIEFKIEIFDNALKDLDKLLRSQTTDKSKKGLGYSAVPPPHPLIYNRPKKLDLSYYGLDEFKEPEFKAYGSEVSEQESNVVCDKKSDDSKENYDESLINCDHHQRKRIVSRNNYNRVDYDYYAKTTYPTIHRNMTPRAVLLKNGLKPLNTVRPANTAHPKPAVHSAESMLHFSKQAQSTAQRPFYKQTSLTRRSVHTAKRHYYTKRPRAGNTARSYTGPVNAVREKGVNVVKTSACWVWRPTKPNGALLALKDTTTLMHEADPSQ